MQPGARFVPALEGLRGVAVAAVLCFHGGFAWASGGFLGVSTFFTLSGFLITRLLLEDWDQHGEVDLGRFWRRRIRRLLPPLLVTVVATAATAPLFADPDQLWALAGDALASIGFFANWRFMAAGEHYADLFKSPSLLLHCWSLGVEGQAYLVLPLLVRTALRRRRGAHGSLGPLLLLVGLIALAAPLLQGASPDRLYYGTDARLLELLVGAALAAWMRDRGWRVARGTVAASVVALLGILVLFTTTTPTSPWVQRGGLGVHALASALVLSGALTPGPVQRLLAVSPLRRLGRVSYAVYLYHWPIFLALTPATTGLGDPALFAVRVAVTLALATLSYWLLERPILARRTPRDEAILATTWMLAGVSALGVAFVQSTFEAPRDPFTRAAQTLAARPEAPAPAGGVRYAIFGDSTGYGTGYALDAWRERHPGRLAWRRGEITAGCGLTGDVEREYLETEPGCDGWQARWRARVADGGIDLAIVQSVRWDVVEQRIPGSHGFTGPGRPDFDAFLRARIAEAIDLLRAQGAAVVWLLSPAIEARPQRYPLQPDTGPERVARLNELVIEVAAARPQDVAVVDLRPYFGELTEAERMRLRPDGIHVARNVAAPLGDWLAPRILRAYAALRPQSHRRRSRSSSTR